jgi:hypothetical protein
MHLPCEGQKPPDLNAEQVGCCSCTQARLMAAYFGVSSPSTSQLAVASMGPPALQVKIRSFLPMDHGRNHCLIVRGLRGSVGATRHWTHLPWTAS